MKPQRRHTRRQLAATVSHLPASRLIQIVRRPSDQDVAGVALQRGQRRQAGGCDPSDNHSPRRELTALDIRRSAHGGRNMTVLHNNVVAWIWTRSERRLR